MLVQDAQALVGCPLGQALECLQSDVLTVAEQWINTALRLAAKIFLALVVLELIVTGYALWTKTTPLGETLQHMAIKVCILATLLVGITWLATHGGALIRAPQTVANELAPSALKTVGGPLGEVAVVSASGTTVTDIVGQGIQLFAKIWYDTTTRPEGILAGALAMINPTLGVIASPASLLILVASFLVLGTFIRVAVELLKVLIEAYIAMGAGAVFLGFAAFRATATLTEGWIRYMVMVSVKLFFVYVVAAFTMTMGNQLIAAYGESTGWLLLVVDPQDPGTATYSVIPGILLVAVSMLVWGLCSLPERLAQGVTQNVSVNIKGWLSKT